MNEKEAVVGTEGASERGPEGGHWKLSMVPSDHHQGSGYLSPTTTGTAFSNNLNA